MKVSVSKVDNICSGLALKNNRSTTFGGGRYAASRKLTKQIMENSPRGLRFLMRMGDNQGEILNSIITAIGTAFIAPIFIIYNPLAKEDKNTRLYSAWRQPISAVIALAAQIGINLKFNHYLDNLASTGQLDTANLTSKPCASYLKQLLKLTKPGLSKEDVAVEMEVMRERAFWQKVDELRNSMKNSPIDISKLIDKDELKTAQGQIEKELADTLKNMSKRQKRKFIEGKVWEYAERNVKAAMESEAKIKYEISQYAQSGRPIKEVINQLQTELKNTKLSEAIALQKTRILEKLKGYGDFSLVKNHGDSFEDVLKSVQIKKMVKAGIHNSEHVVKQYKVWGGIFISLLTLPFSCGLLNWVYPRLMEYIMPEASKAKKAKAASNGGAK